LRLGRFWLILVFAIVISFGLAFLIFNTFIVADTYSFDMYLRVGNTTSINVDTDSIYFAGVRPGNSATKMIRIANDGIRRKVTLEAEGEFTGWLSYEKTEVMEANQEKEVAITVNVPDDAEYGNYKGKLEVCFYRWQR